MNWIAKVREIKRTRKEHRCEGCYQMIPAGSPARYTALTYMGEFQTGYLHPECAYYIDTWTRDAPDYEGGSVDYAEAVEFYRERRK